MLELSGISKRYGPVRALGPVSLSVAAGETVVLLGTSGSGKSTLLKVMNGLVRPDAGEVKFRGERVDPGRSAALRRRMGYVVQGGGLFPHLTAGDNAALVARFLGWEEQRIGARLEELAALARLPGERLSRFPGQLSGGESQRVSLMRALMLDPDVLLLDEPLGALDPITRRELQEDLREAFRRVSRTVVLVTHDLGEAAFFAGRVVLLHEGVIVQEGAFDELVRSPRDPFVTRFVNAQRVPRALAAGEGT